MKKGSWFYPVHWLYEQQLEFLSSLPSKNHLGPMSPNFNDLLGANVSNMEWLLTCKSSSSCPTTDYLWMHVGLIVLPLVYTVSWVESPIGKFKKRNVLITFSCCGFQLEGASQLATSIGHGSLIRSNLPLVWSRRRSSGSRRTGRCRSWSWTTGKLRRHRCSTGCSQPELFKSTLIL